MSWLHELFRAAASAHEHGSFDPTATGRLAEHIGVWFQHLSQNAVQHWSPHLVDVHACDFCEADAMTVCIACGSRVCLAHSHVSFRGEAVCDECVQTLIATPRKTTKPPRRRKRVEPPQTVSRIPADVAVAQKVLGVGVDDSWESVRKTYKKLAREYHPDLLTNASPSAKAAANIKLKQLNGALEVLQVWYRRNAA